MNIGNILRVWKKEVLHFFRPAVKADLSDFERRILGEIQSKGYAVVPGFFSKEQCADFRRILDGILADGSIKIWRSVSGADSRIFGADRISSAVQGFFRDAGILRILSSYEKSGDFSGFTMANRIHYVPGNLGSGEGWHRDRADFKQTKAIIYLSEVDGSSGPTQYIEGSHRFKSVWLDSLRAGIAPLESRLKDSDVDGFLRRTNLPVKEFTAQEGTLLLLDTRGIHRGKPLAEGKARYAMTNYYWFDSGIPPHIAELLVDAKEPGKSAVGDYAG